jgi:hypothetical protein
MNTVYQSKEEQIGDTPLLLFDCAFGTDLTEHWSTHEATVNGIAYAARVLKQNVFEVQFGSDLGVDAIPSISIELGNADSHFSEIENSVGVKGGQLTVSLVFYSFPNNSPSSSTQVLFKGILNPPEQVTEETFRISASNRLSLQRVVLPDIRLQKRCPWNFPTQASQRQEAVSGGSAGKFSRYYRCGYSPDMPGGVGNFAAPNTVFTSCAYTRSDCTARGMFNSDSLSNITARFGGIEFVPSAINVRSAGEKGFHVSGILDNQARYNDFIPLVYGTAWHSPGIVFARNDGNLTHFELVLGAGEIQDVQMVLVNSIEIPKGQNGQNMTGTGWYNLVSAGQRNGSFNLDFTDANGNPLGDPYGSMAYLSVVVPNRINDGTTIPSIQVLLDGLQITQYDSSGNNLGDSFSNNPGWVILDLLGRIGWSTAEIDLTSFAAAASYCAEAIQTTDLFGNPVTTPRFQCNLILKLRRTAADAIRGIRNANRLMLRYGANGLLQLSVENSIALQQPAPGPGSNAQSSLNGGWAAYEFGDGTSSTTGIARTSKGSSSVTRYSRSTADTPNRFVAEFQDAFNDYQQDSLSIVNADDVAVTGQEITSTTPVLGLPHFDQAARVLQFYLDKSIGGNTFLEFQTSIKALGLSPGDIIAFTYLKEGYERQPFRIVKIQPGPNYRTAKLTVQIHDDGWYLDTNGQTTADGSRRQITSSVGLPRPLAGTTPNPNGGLDFGVTESVTQAPDGTATVTATVSFSAPQPSTVAGPDVPLLSLAPVISDTGGSLEGAQNLYYSVSSQGTDGSESGLSFLVFAPIPAGSTTNTVTLTGLSFPSTAVGFCVYRGATPSNLFQIAASQPLAATFVDSGLPLTTVLPPDPSYDHADFYWRLELEPPTTATTYSSSSIGSSILQMIPGSYSGMVARVISGTGVSQERVIASNTVDTLNLASTWDITPDFTSSFVVAQGTYQFGAISQVSPVQFTIPNQAGNVVEISGRSANCNGVESPYEVSPLTRWTIGGAGITNVDAAPPAAPIFGVSVPENVGGTVVFGTLAFPDLNNLATVTAGTYSLFYLDELNPGALASLTADIGETDVMVGITPALGNSVPSCVLIDSEIIGVGQVSADGMSAAITRGLHGSIAASHTAGTSVFSLGQQVFVVSFPKNFFGTPASGDWSYPVSFPNVRIVSAELTVTNSQGSSPPNAITFTGLQDGGLRTLSGGQFSFQVGGFLAVQTTAAPDIIIDAPKVVRDIYAVVSQAPSGAPVSIAILLNGNPYCALTIPDGATTVAAAIDGVSLPPMHYQDRLSLNITGVGQQLPGSGLTVIIRV